MAPLLVGHVYSMTYSNKNNIETHVKSHHKVVVVVMLPGSDLPSTYNYALWWTLEDMWEVVGSLPTTLQRRWPSRWPYGCRGDWQRVVLLSVWLRRPQLHARSRVEATFWQGDSSLWLGCLGILEDMSEDPTARSSFEYPLGGVVVGILSMTLCPD
jgi:hypothetical protein